jgi:DNA-binding transcriptional regulator YiaG
MPNIASLLKSEIARVARKEVRGETVQLKKAVSTYRSEIAQLKRRAGHDDPSQPFRFSAKGLASHRKRLGLSAHDCGLLLGASGQSVYKWEEGEVRPRAKHMPAIATLRAMGKKEANARLAELR